MLDSVLWITDTFFVSGLGDEALAAVGAGGYAAWLFFVVNQLFFTGVLVLVAQAYGADEVEEASRITGETLTIALLASIPLALLGLAVSRELIGLILGNASGTVYVLSLSYLQVRLIGLIPSAALWVYNAVFRAVGRTKPIMVSMLSASLVNIVLDPLLIYGLLGFPKLGVRGAAAASVAAIVLDTLMEAILAYKLLPFSTRPLIPGKRAVLSLKIGVPALLERMAFTVGNLAYLGSIARCGDTALAAHTIGIRIESFAFLPASAMATAASSLTGHEMGRGGVSEAMRVGWEVSKSSALFMVIVGAVLVLISPIAPLAFTKSREVAFLSMIYLILAGISEPALGLVMSLAGSIRGAGNTVIPSVANLAGLYSFRVIPAYMLPKLMPSSLCAIGAWIAMDLDLFLRATVFLILYRSFFKRIARKLV